MHLPECEKSAISHTIAHTLADERTRSSTWMNLIQRSLIRLVINTCQHVHSLDYAHIKLIRFIT